MGNLKFETMTCSKPYSWNSPSESGTETFLTPQPGILFVALPFRPNLLSTYYLPSTALCPSQALLFDSLNWNYHCHVTEVEIADGGGGAWLAQREEHATLDLEGCEFEFHLGYRDYC